MTENAPVGVVDSGVGGLSVLREIRKLLPFENIIYFADEENAPYGTKKPSEIIKITDRNVAYLEEFGCKAIVIACNTATSAAAETVRQKYRIPIIGLEPAIKPAVRKFPGGKILLLATPITLRLPKLEKLINEMHGEADFTCIPAPGLVGYVESGNLCSEETVQYLKKLFSPYSSVKFDACVLGCTHFPFAVRAISRALGYSPVFFDGGAGAAKRLCDILNKEKIFHTGNNPGYIVWNTRFKNHLERLLYCNKF